MNALQDVLVLFLALLGHVTSGQIYRDDFTIDEATAAAAAGGKHGSCHLVLEKFVNTPPPENRKCMVKQVCIEIN